MKQCGAKEKKIRFKYHRNKDKSEVSISLQSQARRVSNKITNTLFQQAYALSPATNRVFLKKSKSGKY